MSRRWRLGIVVGCLLAWGGATDAVAQTAFQGCHIPLSNPAQMPIQCRVGRGLLSSVTINTKGTGSNYTYIFDLASYSYASVAGLPIMAIDTTVGPITLFYNIFVTNGVVVWNTFGATTADLTVSVE